MSANQYPFQIGDIACVALLDGVSPIERDRFLRRFPDAGEADYRQAFAEMGLTLADAISSLNVLLVRMEDETILVDAGEGGKPRGGQLLRSMQAAGVDPAAVTLVIITHTHGDHVQGLLTEADTPAFPNARYVISQAELAFWQTRIAAGIEDHQPLLTLMQAKGLRTIAMDETILPGLTAMPIPGHTPGQIGLLFESGADRLLHLADLLHSPMQFAHPEWSAVFDADTRVSVPTRRHALGRAADDHLLTFFYHLGFPGLGRVQRAGQGFKWQPLDG